MGSQIKDLACINVETSFLLFICAFRFSASFVSLSLIFTSMKALAIAELNIFQIRELHTYLLTLESSKKSYLDRWSAKKIVIRLICERNGAPQRLDWWTSLWEWGERERKRSVNDYSDITLRGWREWLKKKKYPYELQYPGPSIRARLFSDI